MPTRNVLFIPALLTALAVAAAGQQAPATADTKENTSMATAQPSGGFKAIINHGMVLHAPAKQIEGTKNQLTYELGICFQLDRTHCLLVSNIDEAGGPDLVIGNDGFVFEKLSDIKPEKAIPINRPEPGYKMKSGQIGFLAKYPVTGGFVPLGAVLLDGTAHPAAGTGLIVTVCRAYPADRGDVAYTTPHDNRGESWKTQETFMEVTQYRWNGKKLTVTGRQQGEKWLGQMAVQKPLTPFCPKDKGLIAPFKFDDTRFRVVRFDWNGHAWTPTALGEPFITDEGECEPCIRQDGKGYVVHTRGRDPKGRIYRSSDGMNFQFVFDHPNHTVPQGFNQGLDGSFYIATNPGPGYLRNPLQANPMEGASFGKPMIVHDQGGVRNDKGERIPFIDHGVGVNVFLEGRWRHLLFYRVCDLKERTFYGFQKEVSKMVHGEKNPIPKLATSGLYAVELLYDKTTVSPWTFDGAK